MKKLVLVLLAMIILGTSCSSPYKKRKRCRGNGSWYGNRNLGESTKSENTYLFVNNLNK
jgi:hypothetical protein